MDDPLGRGVGGPVRREQAQSILIAGLGVPAVHLVSTLFCDMYRQHLQPCAIGSRRTRPAYACLSQTAIRKDEALDGAIWEPGRLWPPRRMRCQACSKALASGFRNAQSGAKTAVVVLIDEAAHEEPTSQTACAK
jgi:hypothetical protein